MREYNYNDSDEDERKEADEFFQEENSPPDDYFSMAHVALAAKEQNQNLLYMTFDFLKNSLFWKWRSRKSKMMLMRETYLSFSKMLEEEQE